MKHFLEGMRLIGMAVAESPELKRKPLEKMVGAGKEER